MSIGRHAGAVAAVAIFGALVSASAVVADTPNSVTIPMRALNGSGENGTATLEPVGGKVRVTIDVTGEANGASEPAHVHFGRCPNIKAVPAYNVGPVVNVHQSAEALGKYVSCGDIGASAVPAPLPTEDSGY